MVVITYRDVFMSVISYQDDSSQRYIGSMNENKGSKCIFGWDKTYQDDQEIIDCLMDWT